MKYSSDILLISSTFLAHSIIIRAGFLLGGPQLAFTDPDMVKHFSSNIYEAKRDGFRDAIPQAAMAGASYCRQHKLVYLTSFEGGEVIDGPRSLSTFRGCVTNGEIWVFFIFNAADSGEGGTVSISDEFRLGEDLSGLSLVLGLLSDWVSFIVDSSLSKVPT